MFKVRITTRFYHGTVTIDGNDLMGFMKDGARIEFLAYLPGAYVTLDAENSEG